MEPDFSINEVCLIAHRQRGIIFAVLINLIVNIIMFCGILPPLIVGIVSWVVFIGIAIFFVKFRNAMKKHIAWTIVSVIFLVLPLIGLLILLANNQCATKILRNAGLKVGFMDVSEADLQKFANPSSTL